MVPHWCWPLLTRLGSVLVKLTMPGMPLASFFQSYAGLNASYTPKPTIPTATSATMVNSAMAPHGRPWPTFTGGTGGRAATLALQLGKQAGQAPRELATAIADRLRQTPGITAVEIAGPGFLNIRLDAGATGALVRVIVSAGPPYGHGTQLAGQRINLEFV